MYRLKRAERCESLGTLVGYSNPCLIKNPRHQNSTRSKALVRTPSRHAPPIHEALQAARKAAGFDTSAAAAAHFGWSVGRYRSHESGARNISDADIAIYAKSFNVSATSIRNPDPEIIDRQLEKARKSAQAPRQEVARRTSMRPNPSRAAQAPHFPSHLEKWA